MEQKKYSAALVKTILYGEGIQKSKDVWIRYKANTLDELQEIMTPARESGFCLVSVFNEEGKYFVY